MKMLRTLLVILPLLCFCGIAVADEKPATEETKTKIKPGPDDPLEKTKPGPIDEDAPKEFKKTESGLKYRILRKSEKAKPTRRNVVTVHYKGWLDNKKIFDSSYQRAQKISFPLSKVIPGWTEGVQLVGKGGMIELEIPGKLGYGQRGIPGTIPPNATLHFLVELYEIK